MKLGSLFVACQLINSVTYISILCHKVSCKYWFVQFCGGSVNFVQITWFVEFVLDCLPQTWESVVLIVAHIINKG